MNSNEIEPQSIGRKVIIGAGWLIFTRFALRSMGLVSTVVLARLLIPEDFGLIAMATAFLGMVQGISALGFHTALIKFQTRERRDYDTAWTLNAIRGVILAAIILVGSQVLPGYFGDPRLENILLALAVQPILAGIGNSRFVELERDLKFSKDFALFTVAKLLSVIVTIAVAIIWRNYWALVAGLLVGSVTRLSMSYILYPYLPRVCFQSTRKLFGFTVWISGVNIANSISHNIDRLFAGGILGIASAGYYYMGQEISALLTRELFEPVARALYPGFAKISDQLEKLKSNALEAVGVFAAVGLPVGIGFAFVAEEFVYLVLGEKWAVIIPMIQILAPILGIQTITNIANGVMMSLGEPRSIFYRSAINLCLRAPLLIVGGVYFGFVGLFVAHAISHAIYFLLNYVMLVRRLNFSAFELINAAQRSLISVAVMAIGVAGIQLIGPEISGSSFAMLAGLLTAKMVLGVALYVFTHLVLWRLHDYPQGIESRILDLMPETVLRKLPQAVRPDSQS